MQIVNMHVLAKRMHLPPRRIRHSAPARAITKRRHIVAIQMRLVGTRPPDPTARLFTRDFLMRVTHNTGNHRVGTDIGSWIADITIEHWFGATTLQGKRPEHVTQTVAY